MLLRAFWRWLQIAGATVAVLAILWLTAQFVFHVRLLNVQTGSMRPTFTPGDALVMQRLNGEGLRIGMIASYHSSRNPSELVTHRVVRVDSTTDSFQTKGDALTNPDPPVRDSLLAGRVVAVLPGMGRALGWLQTIPGLVVCVYLPATAITVSELYKLEQQYVSKQLYRLRGRQVI